MANMFLITDSEHREQSITILEPLLEWSIAHAL